MDTSRRGQQPGAYDPREVERVLEEHPAVIEAAVSDLPSSSGDEVTAWVVPSERLRPQTLIEHARTLLAPDQCPTQVFVVDSLPRDDRGLPHRSALVEEALTLDTSGLEQAVAKLWRAEL